MNQNKEYEELLKQEQEEEETDPEQEADSTTTGEETKEAAAVTQKVPEQKPEEKTTAEPDSFAEDKALLEKLDRQLVEAERRQREIPKTEETRKQVDGQEKVIKKIRDEQSRLFKRLVRAGLIEDDGEDAEAPAAPAVDQEALDRIIEERVNMRIHAALTPIQERAQRDALFAEAHELQAKFPFFKTKENVQAVATNPYHPEYSKVTEMDKVIAFRNSNPAYRQLRLAQVYTLMKGEFGSHQEELDDAKRRGREELIKKIEKSEKIPATVGAASGAQVEEKILKRYNLDSPAKFERDLDKLDSLPLAEQEKRLRQMEAELSEIAETDE